jgi:hypothetical protein
VAFYRTQIEVIFSAFKKLNLCFVLYPDFSKGYSELDHNVRFYIALALVGCNFELGLLLSYECHILMFYEKNKL